MTIRSAITRRKIILSGLCAAMAAAVSPAFSGEPAGHLRIAGSSTMAPLLTAIARRFETEHPQVRIDVEAVGSGRGAIEARAGTADIGMVSSALEDGDKDLVATPIARDGLAVVVHKRNAVPPLSEHQLVDIFTGRITRWSDVGGPEAPIVVGKIENNRGSSEIFTDYFHLRFDDIQAQHTLRDNVSRVRFLMDNPNGILYMSLGIAESIARAGRPIRLLSLGGVAATDENVRNGSYKLARELNLVTRGKPAGLAKTFIDYARSRRVADLTTAHNFIPVE